MDAVSTVGPSRPTAFSAPENRERLRPAAGPERDRAAETAETPAGLSRSPPEETAEPVYAPDKAVLRLLKTSVKQFAHILQTTGNLPAAKALSGLRVDVYA